MLPEQAQAMLSGVGQGQALSQSILPSVYQPNGGDRPRNPYEGSLDMIADQLLEVAARLREEGSKFRNQVEELYSLSFKVKKLNNNLTDIVTEGESDEL